MDFSDRNHHRTNKPRPSLTVMMMIMIMTVQCLFHIRSPGGSTTELTATINKIGFWSNLANNSTVRSRTTDCLFWKFHDVIYIYFPVILQPDKQTNKQTNAPLEQPHLVVREVE